YGLIPYTWSTPPSGQYPDNGNELMDGLVGDPKDPRDPAWIGVVGAVDVTFDFGLPQPIDWVAVHVLSNRQWGIFFPTAIELYCLDPDNGWGTASSAPIDPMAPSAEGMLANHDPLGKRCRRLEVWLDNSAANWTFLSEIEISSR